MAKHHSLNRPSTVNFSPDFILVHDAWGQPVPVPRQVVENAAACGQPVLVALTPEACRAALAGRSNDPRERFSEADTLIAEWIDAHHPCNAGQIAQGLEAEHDHIIEATGVRDRFRKGLPLRAAKYHSTGDGYLPPAE